MQAILSEFSSICQADPARDRRLRPSLLPWPLIRQDLLCASAAFDAWARRSHPPAGAARHCAADAGPRRLLGDGARWVRASEASRDRCRERRPVAGGALGAVWAPPPRDQRTAAAGAAPFRVREAVR